MTGNKKSGVYFRSKLILGALVSVVVSHAAVASESEKEKKGPEKRPPTYADVPYDVHERTRLDFWQAEGEGPRPLLVYIHGGGWTGGDKSSFAHAEKSLARGISVAAINYRYSTAAPLPAPVMDAVRAVQFLRHQAEEWNIDKDRVMLNGVSAGGCTALWIACHDDLADPGSPDPVLRESSRVQGAAVVAAQTSIDPKEIEPWIGPNVFHRMIYRAVGEKSIEVVKENYAAHEETYKAFSPINHLTPDDPPLFLRYSDDITVPAKNFLHGIHHGQFGIRMKQKAEEVGFDHLVLVIGRPAPEAEFQREEDFVDAILLRK